MTATITDSDVRLRELVEQAAQGDVILVYNNKPVARIVPIREPSAEGAKWLEVPSYHLGFRGSLPSRAEIADEMFGR